MAAVSLPREINRSTVMQSARPALQVRRPVGLVGTGADAVRAVTATLMVGAALGLFAALVQVLQERRMGLAVMRVPGATRWRLFWQIMAGSLILTAAGAGFGLATSHLVAWGARLWLWGAQATPGALCLG